jgi:hypothetical protein
LKIYWWDNKFANNIDIQIIPEASFASCSSSDPKAKGYRVIVIKKNTIGPRKDDDLDKYTFESL